MKSKNKCLGMVWMVGAGPGGDGLITRKGYGLLRRADVVVYDYLVDPVLLKDVRPGAETICCAELGKGHAGTDPTSQKRINGFLVARARAGKLVVRLKSGDPAIFGRITEEIAPLIEAKIPWEIVPGVTAASAAAAGAGVSLTQRRVSSSVTFVTGREAAGTKTVDWTVVGRSGNLVLYMAVERARKIAEELMTVRPAKTPVVIVCRAGHADERTIFTTLSDLARSVRKAKLRPPAIFIIGETACPPKGLAARGRKVLVTETVFDPSEIKGAAIHVPMIEIRPMADRKIDRYIASLREFDWIMFTSRYGVGHFFERLLSLGQDARFLHDVKVAVIGESTARYLAQRGVCADVVAKEESSQGLLKALKSFPLRGKRVLIPCSALSCGMVAQGLNKAGMDVVMCPVYQNVMPKGLPDLDFKSFQEIYFASPSGVRNFRRRYGKPVKKTIICAVGDVTLAEAKKVFGRGYVYTTKQS